MARSVIHVSTDVDLHGPLFDGRAEPILREFYDDAAKLVAEAGVEQVRERVWRRAERPTGAFADAVNARRFKRAGWTILADYPQVLYGPWLEGTSQRNTSTRFKGYSLFRLTRLWLRKHLSEIVQGRLDRAVGQLNGGR